MIHNLPDFPWDVLAPYAERAAEYPGGRIDLSVGTPVDATPLIVQQALAAAADAPGYPPTAGIAPLRAACAGWLRRRLGAEVPDEAILPTIGSKEFVGSLPTLLGLGTSSRVAIPSIAYPTYAVGAAMVGAQTVATDEPEQLSDLQLIWLNSPSNPTGRVNAAERMAEVLAHARRHGTVVASDECYIELGWEAQPVSVLHPRVTGGDLTGVIALFSLSKRSNLAGYRFGFAAGDPALIANLLATRKHLGMMVPMPVQRAAIAALDDDVHVEQQRERYAGRRSILSKALEGAGFEINHSEAGLYLWVTRQEPCWDSVEWFADRGIVVTPGSFYGERGAHHVRVALTCTDDDAVQFAARLPRSASAD